MVGRVKGTPTHNSWHAMLQRCRNPRSHGFSRYGARGIAVCERWLVFANFLADMGERPAGMTLDRIDNDGDYEPGNCRWASRVIQANNTRANRFIEWDGRRQTLTQWAREFRVDADQVTKALRGRKLDDAMYRAMFCYPGVQTPARLLTHDGKTQSLKAWARDLGICSKSLRQRLERWPTDVALSFPSGSRIKKEMTQ